ncbi:Vigilin 1 [Tolypocladium capitatum]|uniref:Vigilin 1 n=1 Tax=Tolypocladium capitatum TaxID=45235 RepID=A0A2K3QD78_9HYPO|nr:Vigilin 1 [Tolypocladium capitatum]
MVFQASPTAAPWEAVPAHEQLFVLITGANRYSALPSSGRRRHALRSGVGLGTAQRLIDEFLATRSLTSHLVLLPTTRSAPKSLQAIREIRAYAVRAAQTSAVLRSRAGAGYRWEDTVARLHVLSLSLDLCDLRAVRRFAWRLRRGTVSNPPGEEGEYLVDVRVPRLDSVIFNAAYGGWAGCDYAGAMWSMLTKGLVQSVTWPSFKNALPTCILNEQGSYNYPVKPLLGEVFAACVFGHYVLAHELLPLLGRSSSATVVPGRIIWSSSVEAVTAVFTVDDMQCFTRPEAYESAKRLTDLLALTASLPAARPFSSRWLTMDDGDEGTNEKQMAPPKVYLTHPGVVASTLFPVPWFLFWAYELALVVSRWLGSPWHTVDGYSGAKAAAWVALQDQPALDAAGADRIKWGSSADHTLAVNVKKTEVEGWGWEGRPEDAAAIAADTAVGVLHKSRGRKRGVVDVTAEDIVRFEELGARCWKEMEELRAEWEDILEEDDDE